MQEREKRGKKRQLNSHTTKKERERYLFIHKISIAFVRALINSNNSSSCFCAHSGRRHLSLSGSSLRVVTRRRCVMVRVFPIEGVVVDVRVDIVLCFFPRTASSASSSSSSSSSSSAPSTDATRRPRATVFWSTFSNEKEKDTRGEVTRRRRKKWWSA